jgi:hypothetical protein
VEFFVSAAPALLLALTVSPTVALGVTLFYVAYNMVENYYIQPEISGRELQLSDLAVITAFLVGGTLGGVLGALIALPVASAYPAAERIWFDRPGTTDTADEHRRIQAQPEHWRSPAPRLAAHVHKSPVLPFPRCSIYKPVRRQKEATPHTSALAADVATARNSAYKGSRLRERVPLEQKSG